MTKNPFLYLTVSFSAGLVCGYFVNRLVFAIPVIAILILVFTGGIFLSGRIPHLKDVVCIFLVSCFGFLYYEGRTRIRPANHIERITGLERPLAIVGDVISLPDKREDRVLFNLEARYLEVRGDTIPISGKIRVTLKGEIAYGNRLKLHGSLNPPPPPTNPGEFDYGSWLRRQNIYGVMHPDSMERLEGNYGNPFIYAAARVRRHVEMTINNNIGGRQASFLKGITIGERGEIPDELKEVFRNTGVVHVLAVSGLHVGIIAFILFLLFRITRIPNIVSLFLISACLIIYALMIDLRPSVVRATLMSILLMAALLRGRDTSLLNVLSLAAFLILLWNPQALFDVGFQLSIGATAGIIYLYPKLYPILHPSGSRILDYGIIRPFTTSLSAQAGTTLLSAHYFYRLPVISILANLVVIPLTGLCIATGLLLSLVNLLNVGLLNKICASAVYGFTTVTIAVVGLFSKIPGGHFWIGSPSPLFLILYFFIILSGINAIHNLVESGSLDFSCKVFVYSVILSLFILLGSRLWREFNPEINITFFDSNNGNCTLVEADRTIVIDGGPYRRTAPPVADLLRREGVSEISLLFLTSPLSYDAGGVSYLLENFLVRGIALPFIPYDSYTYRSLVWRIKKEEIPYVFIEEGNELGGFRVINPAEEGGLSLGAKDASLVLYFEPDVISGRDESCSVLFMGHLEREIRKKAREADVLKAPYFGGYRDPTFLEVVRPSLTVISVGENRWGLPSEEMIREYGRYGDVIRTDDSGACVISIQRNGFLVRTMSQGEPMLDRFLRWTGFI